MRAVSLDYHVELGLRQSSLVELALLGVEYGEGVLVAHFLGHVDVALQIPENYAVASSAGVALHHLVLVVGVHHWTCETQILLTLFQVSLPIVRVNVHHTICYFRPHYAPDCAVDEVGYASTDDVQHQILLMKQPEELDRLGSEYQL